MLEATTALVEAARAIITTYAVYSVIVGLIGLRRARWEEIVEGIGGVLWVLGSALWRLAPDTPGYDADLVARSLGVALLLLPRVVHVARAAASSP